MVSAPVKQRRRELTLEPQQGPQTDFFQSTADIVVYGGAAGGGKTFALLMEPLRHFNNPLFRAVIFRRSSPQITNPGGLWEEASRMYTPLGGVPRVSDNQFTFPSGMTVRFAHLIHADSVYDWQGSQIPLIGFDELTHFLESQFWYMLSRLRSMSGVKGYVRATCNPDAGSWVKKLLAPWVDRKAPDSIKAMPGEIRHFIRDGEELVWGTSPDDEVFTSRWSEEDIDRRVRSITFIAASVFDNKALLNSDPTYLAWLESLPPIDKMRLLYGDWNVTASAGKIISREWFHLIHDTSYVDPEMRMANGFLVKPEVRSHVIRFWDFAATEKAQKTTRSKKDPDYTVGLKMMRKGDHYTILDVVRGQMAPAQADALVVQKAIEDYQECQQYDIPYYIRWEEEGGASGKRDSYHLITKLSGFDAQGIHPTRDKVTRVKAFSSQAMAGNVSVLDRWWTDTYLTELHQFPNDPHDDQVDATSGAYNALLEGVGDVIETENVFDV